MKKGLVALCLLCVGITSAAQVYQTKAGTIRASGRYNGANVTAVSNHLHMQINYDRAELKMRLMVPAITTDNDSLNLLLQKLASTEGHFTGKMNISYLPTKSHPKQQFLTSGIMTINGIAKAFSFTSTLEHYPRGSVSCVLSGEFALSLIDFGLVTSPEENKMKVSFTQLILKRLSEQ